MRRDCPRDIRAHLAEVSDWQNRALEPICPIVFLGALRIKIRDAENLQVQNQAVYVGLWVANNERAKFWLSAMNNLKNRGVEDIIIAVVDGLKGFPDAINAAFPATAVRPASFSWCAICGTFLAGKIAK